RYWLYQKFGEKILKVKKDGSFLLHPKAPCFCPFSIPIHGRPNSITEVTKELVCSASGSDSEEKAMG
ncbi:unnamed protein product, partial [Musa hybrid cultivar]